ncbi:MAG: hypothetical protein ACR2MN_14065 [Acidimicrobiales bacterium]
MSDRRIDGDDWAPASSPWRPLELDRRSAGPTGDAAHREAVRSPQGVERTEHAADQVQASDAT